MRVRILVAVESDELALSLGGLVREGHDLVMTTSSAVAWEDVVSRIPDILLASPKLSDGDALPLLSRVQRHFPDLRLVLLAARDENPERLRRLHALLLAECLVLPASPPELRRALLRAVGSREDLARAAAELASARVHRGLVGESAAWVESLARASSQAWKPQPLLLLGEAGSGKTSVARAVHALSSRSAGPLVVLPCLALTDEELASSLLRARQAAAGGTLVIEDVFALLPQLQDELAATLSVADDTPRIIATSDLNLEQAVASGRATEQLAAALSSIQVVLLPPLAERGADLALHAVHLLSRAGRRLGIEPRIPTQGAMRSLSQHVFRGGLRELAAIMERAAALAEPGPRVDASDLGLNPVGLAGLGRPLELPVEGIDLPRLLTRIEGELIDESLRAVGDCRQRAAELLGLQRTTLVQKLRRRHSP